MAADPNLIGINIADRYCITGKIGAGGMGQVYSAISYEDPSRTVAIKLIQSDKELSSEDLLRFQKEAALMSQLHHPNIICFYELGLLGNENIEGGAPTGLEGGYYIVMEVAEGEDLKNILKTGIRKDLGFFFNVGLKISSALAYTHSKNIIHRDIKPQNIIVGKIERGNHDVPLKVLDFGIARLSEIQQFESQQQDIAGTPLYMAPETSKYLTAPVDHRADLYSLGCVLYEVLTGKPPFTASNRTKLIKDHAFSEVEPISASRPDVPEIINNLVLKLLAKEPEHRYQSAYSLQIDLQKIKTYWEAGNDIRRLNFALGGHDKLITQSSRVPLIGRQEEIKILEENYEAISRENGRSRMVVLKGEPGTGKSRLLREYRSILNKRNIRYITATFSRHENNLPFNALANGFNEYLIRVYKSQVHETEKIRANVKVLLGKTAHDVAKVVPALKHFITDIENSDNDELEKLITENQEEFDFSTFAKAFSDFTRCLATDNQPVAFIFDDMHWADSKTINLIDKFFSHNNSQRFLLVVGYQSFRLMGALKFKEFLEKFSKLRRRYTELELKNFNIAESEHLMREVLNTKEEIPSELINYLQRNTGGNPLFLTESIRSFVAQGYIYEDDDSERWAYKLDNLYDIKLKVDSIDLMLLKLQTYDPIDRQILELASLAGSTFSFEVLLTDENMDRAIVMKALKNALKQGLILHSEEIEDESTKHFGKFFTFSHGRVREMIKDMIPISKRQQLHLKIAQRLESLVEKPSRQLIFTMAHHYNQATDGKDEIAQDVSLLVMKYNIFAGEAAMKTHSLVSADRYFKVAEDFSGRKAVAYNHPKMTERTKKYALEKLGDISMLNTRFKQAKGYYKQLLTYKVDKEAYSALLYKIYYIEFLNGRVTSTLSEIDNALYKITKKKKSKLRLDLFSLMGRISLDGIQGKGMKLWRVLEDVEQGKVVRPKRRLSAVYLEHMAGHEVLHFDLLRALLYHNSALKLVYNEQAPLRALLITAADHATILAYLGFTKKSYDLFDKSIRVAKKFHEKDALAYIYSKKILTVDHFKNKYDEYDSSSNEVRKISSFQKNYPVIAQQFVFELFQKFQKGESLQEDALQIGSVLRTRYYQSARAVSIYLFSQLLRGQYQIVAEHSRYIERRKQVGARDKDIFVTIIKSLIAHASGEKDKALNYFNRLLDQFNQPFHERFLLPFEEDFVASYLVLYVDLFKLDFSSDLLSPSILKKLEAVKNLMTAPRNKARPASAVLKTRIDEFENGSKVKAEYDAALKEAILSGSHLYVIVSKIWFARLLVSEGQTMRKDYLEQASELASLKGFETLKRLSDEVLVENKLIDQSEESVHIDADDEFEFKSLWTEHLEYIPEANYSEVSFREALSGSFDIFSKYFDYDYMELIFSDVRPGDLGLTQTTKYEDIKDYINPYLSLRSTLLLPSMDAPWNQDIAKSSEIKFLNESEKSFSKEVVDQTQVLDVTNAVDITGTLVLSATTTMGELKDDSLQGDQKRSTAKEVKRSKTQKINAVIPIQYNGINIGAVFVEHLDISKFDSIQVRNALDKFGLQFGLWVTKKFIELGIMNSSLMPSYKPGSYIIEDCPWLDVWSQGHLRQQRESTWYLGLNMGDDYYLMAYCRMEGGDYDREAISHNLWLNLLAFKSKVKSKESSSPDIDQLHDEVKKLMLNDNRFQLLNGLSISLSVVIRSSRKVISGHFGPSRPMVLGGKNEVLPANEVMMKLANGRAIRFWKVISQAQGKSIYVLPHDSNKLDNINLAQLSSKGFFEAELEEKQLLLRDAMSVIQTDISAPRYYIASTFIEAEEKVEDEPLQRVD